MVIFHSYVMSLPEGKTPLNPMKPSFSYGFPMVFLWNLPVFSRTHGGPSDVRVGDVEVRWIMIQRLGT